MLGSDEAGVIWLGIIIFGGGGAVFLAFIALPQGLAARKRRKARDGS